MDRSKFYASLRQRASGVFGTSLSQSQVDGCEALLNEGQSRGVQLRQLAYVLATAYHETAHTMKPIEEYGKGRGRPYGKPAGPYGKLYFGRGYVQLTWLANYQKAGEKLSVNLVKFPEQALAPEIAAEIIFAGMSEGWFTGKKLSDYIDGDHIDYSGARRIVNGTDRALYIAGYAKAFETALRSGGYVGQAPKPSPGPIFGPPPLGTPIPGTVKPAEPVAPPAPPVAAKPSPGKTAAAAGFLAIIALTLATWWHEVTAWVSSLF